MTGPTGPSGPPSGPVRDDAWFDALFRDHARSVFRFVVRRAARDDADDLTAEVFTTAWRRREDVPEGFELAWLYRTAGFTVANHHRKTRPVLVETLPEAGDPTSPELLVLADLEVREAFARLGERDQQILLLAAWEGLQGEALASVLEISRSGADAALSRARSRLRQAWDDSAAATVPGEPAARSTDATTQTR
nr:sigma-70 family RNA polymerase sigma factor [Sanguibacter gelidistatuariae]